MVNYVRLESSGIKPTYCDHDDSTNILEDIKNLKISFIKKTKPHTIIEVIGLNVSIANALRRILLSEVPTLAIETVQIYQNTGVIQDELLAHRLGLVPFVINPDLFSFKNHDEMNENNNVCFKLKVRCNKVDLKRDKTSISIYTSDLKWVPLSPTQENLLKDDPPRPVYDNILLTKLSPGQEIDLKVFLEKGIGKTHAKWSPVSTAVYRFKPYIEFSSENPLTNDEKKQLYELCPMKVFGYKDGDISIESPLSCTSCRACVERFPENIRIKKYNNHIIFSIESTGSIPSDVLFLKAIEILKQKTFQLKKRLSDCV